MVVGVEQILVDGLAAIGGKLFPFLGFCLFPEQIGDFRKLVERIKKQKIYHGGAGIASGVIGNVLGFWVIADVPGARLILQKPLGVPHIPIKPNVAACRTVEQIGIL